MRLNIVALAILSKLIYITHAIQFKVQQTFFLFQKLTSRLQNLHGNAKDSEYSKQSCKRRRFILPNLETSFTHIVIIDGVAGAP